MWSVFPLDLPSVLFSPNFLQTTLNYSILLPTAEVNTRFPLVHPPFPLAATSPSLSIITIGVSHAHAVLQAASYARQEYLATDLISLDLLLTPFN